VLSSYVLNLRASGAHAAEYTLIRHGTKTVSVADVFLSYLTVTKKRSEGKHYNVAISHACKKLVRVIYHLETTGEFYMR